MPPAASTGTSGPTASTAPGPEPPLHTVAGVPAGLGALRDDDVDADLDLLLRVPLAADEGRDEDAVFVRPVDDLLGRRAERVDEQLHAVVLERGLQSAGGLVVDAEPCGAGSLVVVGRQRRDAVL